MIALQMQLCDFSHMFSIQMTPQNVLKIQYKKFDLSKHIVQLCFTGAAAQ